MIRRISILYSLFLLCTATVFVSCENDIAEVRAITDPRNLPVQTNINAEYRYTEDGKVKNILTAAQLDQYGGEKPYIEASGGFHMSFFDSLGGIQAEMTAKSGTYYEKEHKLIAWGDVLLFNKQGEKLETSKILFEQDSSRISTDQGVKITTMDGVLYGKGLVSNENFTKYSILQPTGDVFLDDESESLVSSPNGKSK
jgi:LPS export ABC transporter protein LptC